MRNLSYYTATMGKGIVYFGKNVIESFRYMPVLSKAMRGDIVGAQEELEEISSLEEKIGEYKN